MAKEIEIETNTLASDIESLQSHLNQISGSLENMFEAVRALDATWDGPANQEFNIQFQNDRESMSDMCKTVQKLINCMTFAKTEYNSCENQVHGIVSSIKI